jgi:hypothetical protein
MTSDDTWGAPQPRRWSTRQTISAVGVAAVIAALGGAAIYAGTGGSNAAGPGRWGGPGGPGGPGGMRPAATLHGEFVVADGNGGYQTELTQTGQLTAVSDASITAKSSDGFTQTYTLGAGAAKDKVAVNDTVAIHATKINGTATATSVEESNGQMGPGGPPPMGSGGQPHR